MLKNERDAMVSENLGLVRYAILKNFPNFINDEDIFQSGCIGLIKAVDAYDEDFKFFSAFAIPCIENEIKMELRKRGSRDGRFIKISIDAPVTLEYGGGDLATLMNMLPMSDDIEFVDIDGFKNSLTPLEIKIVQFLILGYSQSQIARRIKKSRAMTSRYISRIRAKAEKYI